MGTNREFFKWKSSRLAFSPKTGYRSTLISTVTGKNMTQLTTLLNEYRKRSLSEREKGTFIEKLIRYDTLILTMI